MYSRSQKNSLTRNAKLRRNLALHPSVEWGMPGTCLSGAAPNCNGLAAGDTTTTSGCTIILLGIFLNAHNHRRDGDLLVGCRTR